MSCVWCALLQEQYDQLQRQLQHVTSREAGLQAEVDAYQLEHSQLLAANTQLMTQCTGLNKEVQVRSLKLVVGETSFTYSRRSNVPRSSLPQNV